MTIIELQTAPNTIKSFYAFAKRFAIFKILTNGRYVILKNMLDLHHSALLGAIETFPKVVKILEVVENNFSIEQIGG